MQSVNETSIFYFYIRFDKDLKHYVTEVPILEMINEAPESDIFVTAKNNANYVPRILLLSVNEASIFYFYIRFDKRPETFHSRSPSS